MVKPAVRKKKSEAGQAILLVIAAMSVFLLGAVGLAVDGSNLYAHRQAAQAAADAAAQGRHCERFEWGRNPGIECIGNCRLLVQHKQTATSPCRDALIMNRFGVSATSSNCALSTRPLIAFRWNPTQQLPFPKCVARFRLT